MGFNAWLLDCAPTPGCAVCATEWRNLKAAEAEGDIGQAAKHAAQIRNHTGGHR
ncbi:hypothetical protein ACWEN4_33055 [Streptomyces violaceorubidus]